MPPARCMSAATKRPEGFRSASSGVRSLTFWKSSMCSGTPISRAIASKCRTALVEPPVAATPAMAFSNAARVRMSFGVMPFLQQIHHDFAAVRTRSHLSCGSMAGTLLKPMGERPIISITVDMVLAVYWPPHAPAAGQATFSSSCNSASLIFPAAFAPTASNTS